MKLGITVYKNEVLIPGQSSKLQLPEIICSPSQLLPPLLGGGLEQVRYVFLTPPPHVFEHGVHAFHSENPPSTKYENEMIHCREFLRTYDFRCP